MARTRQHSLWFHLFDVLLNIVIIVAIVAAIRTFLVSPFQVEGNSMMSTLAHKEYIIINKLAYIIGEPERGDIVVFRPPTDHEKHYVKRVIGMPGDTVIIRAGKVYLVNGETGEERELPENYLDERNTGKTFRHPPSSGDSSRAEYTVPEETYFLLGDNRQGSLDSRSFADEDGNETPFVPREDIKGRVWFVALPVTKIHALEPPEYGF